MAAVRSEAESHQHRLGEPLLGEDAGKCVLCIGRTKALLGCVVGVGVFVLASITLVERLQSVTPVAAPPEPTLLLDISMIPAQEATFLQDFRSHVLAESTDTVPPDFARLVSIPTVSIGGGSSPSVSAGEVPGFLKGLAPPVPPILQARLASGIPALMFAGAGKVGYMAYQRFYVTGAQGEVQVAHVAAMVRREPPQTSAIAVVYGDAAGSIIQQYTTWHQGCCNCKVGRCWTWIRIGCHGCDRSAPVADTPAQIASMQQGLLAELHRKFAANFPVEPPSPWSSLATTLSEFLQSPDTHTLLHRDDTIINGLPELSDIMSMISVLKIPQVLSTNVPSVIRLVSSGNQFPQAMVEAVLTLVQASAANSSWVQTDALHSNGNSLDYFAAFARQSVDAPASSVDLVMASYHEAARMDKLTIVSSSTYSSDGSVHTDVQEIRAPLAGHDLRRFQVQWKCAVDRAVLSSLLRPSPDSVALHARFSILPIAMFSLPFDAFDGLRSIISNAAPLWQTVASGFASTSRKIQIISQRGFDELNEVTTAHLVPFVSTSNTGPFIDAAMAEYSAETRSKVKASLEALQFSESKTDDAVWLREQVVFNKNRSQGGCGAGTGCAEFFVAHLHPLPAQSHNHWSLCTYGLDFILAPTLEVITTSRSFLFGLWTDTHDELVKLPAVFTVEDKNHLQQFLSVQCQYHTGLALGMTGLTPPVFPPLR